MINYKNLICETPDFPISGVLFRDVSPVLENPQALQQVIADMGQLINLDEIDSFVGVESRGFIFASMLAAKFNKGFIPLRKAGKLPPPVVQKSYSLEYGQATLEMIPSKNARGHQVVIIDDVLATGGTLAASIELCGKANYKVVDILVLINLTFLNQMKFGNELIKSVIQYDS